MNHVLFLALVSYDNYPDVNALKNTFEVFKYSREN
jgi:hypothetical protein